MIQKMSFFESCTHDHIVDGSCSNCGLDFEGSNIDMTSSYSEYHSHTDSYVAQPFENDLKSLSIPDEVKNFVIRLALACPKETHRMGVRRQQLFSYILFAYLQLGYTFEPDKIIEEMKMTKRETNMALRIVSGTSSTKISLPLVSEDGDVLSAPVVVISPIVYIENLCEENNLMENYSEILEHSRSILEKNRGLLDYNPKHMAITLIKHYLKQKGINIPKFAKNNGISESILKQHMNRIVN